MINMKINKIGFVLLLLIFAIGIVSAATVSDIKVADGFKDLGDGSYTNDADKINIDIMDEKDVKN